MESISINEDLIVNRAELTCNVDLIQNNSIKKVYELSAYPTVATRNLTNSLSSNTENLAQIAAKCQWVTPGIVQFFIHPSTQKMVEARLKLGCIELSLQTLLSNQHKQKLAEYAKHQYWNLPVTSDNFSICLFRTFIAELHISVRGMKRTFFGKPAGNKQVYPFHVHFEIDDAEDLKDVAAQLENPCENDFWLQYYYTLSGSSVTNASVTITADQVAQNKLENDIFGDSKMDSMIVSRQYMEKIASNVISKLKVCETIGLGADPLNYDLIKQAVFDSITPSFKKYSIEELRAQLASGMTHISQDLQANIRNSYQHSQDVSDHRRGEAAYERTTSDLNEKKEHKAHSQNDTKKTSQSGEGSLSGSGWGVTVDIKGKGQNDETTDKSTNEDNQTDLKTDVHHSVSNKAVVDTEQGYVGSTTLSGTKVNAKTIDAAIIDRWRIQNGFVITLDRWVHQLASTYVSGRLTSHDIPRIVPEEGRTMNDDKSRGTFCGILKSSSTGTIINGPTTTDLQDAFNILITGRSGVGKSTLIDLIHNYFLNRSVDNLVRIVDEGNERRDQSMKSSTCQCVRYFYRSEDGYLYQIIDSPGLADTSGDEQDEKNMQSIIEAAQSVNHINCVLFVCNGTGDTRLGLDIRTTFVLLKNNLPTAVLDNVMAFFTFTSDLSENKCDLNEVLRLENGSSLIDVNSMPKFCADSSFFSSKQTTCQGRALTIYRQKQEYNYELACEQISLLLEQVRQMRPVSSDTFSAVIESRNRIMANIAQIRVQLNTIAKLADALDAAKDDSSRLDRQVKANKEWKKHQSIEKPHQIDVPYKNTLCSIHCCNCHIKCQLHYIEGVGSSEFKNCAAFNLSNICSNPDCVKSQHNNKCTFEHHYHDCKEWRMVEQTIEVVYEDMKQAYEKSFQDKKKIDEEINAKTFEKEIITYAFDIALEGLLEECKDMSKKVKGFNLIAYIDVVLEALNKKIKDISHTEQGLELKGKVDFFKKLVCSLQNPRSTHRLTYRR